MTPEEYRKKIEYKVVGIIEEGLRRGSLNSERVRSISRLVLDKLTPDLTIEEIYEVVPLLDDNFPELTPIVTQVLKDKDTEIVDLVVSKIHELLRNNQIKEAGMLVDNVLNQKK